MNAGPITASRKGPFTGLLARGRNLGRTAPAFRLDLLAELPQRAFVLQLDPFAPVQRFHPLLDLGPPLLEAFFAVAEGLHGLQEHFILAAVVARCKLFLHKLLRLPPHALV